MIRSSLCVLRKIPDGIGVFCFDDQEHIPVEEVFEQLRCTKEGLSDEEATARLAIFGYNKLEEKNVRSTRSLSFSFCKHQNFDRWV